jgi:F-type H+-transporting ATPase subunit b
MNLRRYFVLALLALGACSAVAAVPARAADDAGTTPGTPVENKQHEGVEETPQLLTGWRESFITAATTLIVFILLVVVLGKYAWGPIAKGLQDREDKIRRDIEEAEAARARAEATQRDYAAQLATAEAKVRELLAKANVDAEQIAQSVRTRAQQEAQDIKENATKEIHSAEREAIRHVHEQAAVLSTRIAEKILRRNLSVDDQRELVQESLEQLQTVKA